MKKRYPFSIFQLLGIISLGVFTIITLIFLILDKFKSLNTFAITYEKLFDLIYVIISGIALYSLRLLNKQIKSEHERARREKCVDLILEWTKARTKENVLIKRIIKNLSKEQCESLLNEQPFHVNDTLYNLITTLLNIPKDDSTNCSFCNHNPCTCESHSQILPENYIIELHWNIISYFNLLEGILVAWQTNIVDAEIMEKEFSPIIIPKSGISIIENFKSIKGFDEDYPAIYYFYLQITNKRLLAIKEKPKIP